MRANEFVKKFGVDEAKEAIKNVAWCGTAYCARLGHGCFKTKSDCRIDINDLKRLVESHEFVRANGGVEGAMKYINSQDPNATSKHYNALRTKVSGVESCQ